MASTLKLGALITLALGTSTAFAGCASFSGEGVRHEYTDRQAHRQTDRHRKFDSLNVGALCQIYLGLFCSHTLGHTRYNTRCRYEFEADAHVASVVPTTDASLRSWLGLLNRIIRTMYPRHAHLFSQATPICPCIRHVGRLPLLVFIDLVAHLHLLYRVC